jgi:L-iditol 2-dehydrogenase
VTALHYADWSVIERADLPAPVPAPDEVRLRVAACGICGSELETFAARSPRRTPPLVMGHEFCGVVESVGSAVAGWAMGDRAVSHSLVSCGACPRCRRGDGHLCARREIFGMHRPGAFAELVCVPARALEAWPDGLPAAQACLAEPLANGVHVAHLVARLAPQRAVVIGAGPIGLFAQQALQAVHGAGVAVADRLPERRAVASRLGAVAVAEPEALADAVAAWTDGEGADVVVDAVGAPDTKRASLDLCRPGGAAVWLGLHGDALTLDSYGVTLPEKTIHGTYAARQSEIAEALALMAAGRVDAHSWTHTAPLADGGAAFRRMLRPSGADLKAILIP